jgi:hypothetical protein
VQRLSEFNISVMIPTFKVNAAYDTLNLPRDATMQAVLDRWETLRTRYTNSGEVERLSKVSEAFDVIEASEKFKTSQREAGNKHVQSRSERDLDEKLSKLSDQSDLAKRTAEESPPVEGIKKQKQESPADVKLTPSPPDVIFDTIDSLLRDPTKYARTMNVLYNMIKAATEDKSQLTTEFIQRLLHTVDIAFVQLRKSHALEENRVVAARVLTILESEPLLRDSMDSLAGVWRHIVRLRNALYDHDNFEFVKRCTEILETVRDLGSAADDDSQRMLQELGATLEVLCSKEIARVIPGRLGEVKKCMTEVFKLSRSGVFPNEFKMKVEELQIQIQSD